MLPDRTPQTLATWLRDHPSVEAVSSGRAEAYARGIREGAPDALQVTDRWHLLKNLTDTVFKELQHHHTAVKRCQPQPPAPASEAPASAETPAPQERDAIGPVTPPVGMPSDQRRRVRAQAALELSRQGWTQKAIAAPLNVTPATVGRDLRRSLPLARREAQRT